MNQEHLPDTPDTPDIQWLRDGRITVDYTRKSIGFIKKHRLWEGFKGYTWLVKGLMVAGAILSFYALKTWLPFFGSDNEEGIILSSLSSISFESISGYLDGGAKYLVLIAIEIIIFHFTRRSMMIVTGDEIDTGFKTFVKAEKRMIKVAIFSFFMESFSRFAFNLGLSIADLSILEGPVMFTIQSFYLGFAIVDNYNELYNMTIKQSHRYTLQFAPVALITGAMLNLALTIPVIGMIVGTVICAVIATLAMHKISQSYPDRAWVYVEKKKKKKKRNK